MLTHAIIFVSLTRSKYFKNISCHPLATITVYDYAFIQANALNQSVYD